MLWFIRGGISLEYFPVSHPPPANSLRANINLSFAFYSKSRSICLSVRLSIHLSIQLSKTTDWPSDPHAIHCGFISFVPPDFLFSIGYITTKNWWSILEEVSEWMVFIGYFLQCSKIINIFIGAMKAILRCSFVKVAVLKLLRSIAKDETWIHHFRTESKWLSWVWTEAGGRKLIF